MSEGTTHNNYGTDPVTINFWAYIPSTIGASEATLIGDHAGVGSGRSIFITSAHELVLYSNSILSYRYAGFTLEDQYKDQWIMITIVLDSDTITNAKFYIQNSTTTNTTAITNTITSGATITTYPDNGGTINHSGFLGCRNYNNAKFPASSSSMSSAEFKIDEYTAWGKALSSSEITALHNNHKVFDYSTHSANSDLFRYIRFGDLTGDSNSTINCKIDSNFDLAKDSGASGTYVNSLTGVDDVFTAANNQNLSNAKGATAENDGALEAAATEFPINYKTAVLQDDSSYDLTSNIWSVGFWFKSNENVGAGNDFSTYGGSSAGGNTYARTLLMSSNKASSNFFGGFNIQSTYSGSGIQTRVQWSIDGSNGWYDIISADSGADLFDGQWHHLLIVKETASPTAASETGFKYYLDGSLKSSTFSSYGTPNFSNIQDPHSLMLGNGHTRTTSDGALGTIHNARMLASTF